jgi:hypothetical protein
LSVERARLRRKKARGKWIGSAVRRRCGGIDAGAGAIGVGVYAVGAGAARRWCGNDVGVLFGEDAYDAWVIVFAHDVDLKFLYQHERRDKAEGMR